MGPTCSIFYEREPIEKDIMKRHPRTGSDKLFRGKELPVTLALGLTVALGLLLVYSYFMRHGYSLEYTRTIVFITFLVSNVLLTFAGRSFKEPFSRTIRYRNNLVPVILLLSGLFLALIYFIPFVRQLFQLTSVRGIHLLAAFGTGLLSIGWFGIYKGINEKVRSQDISITHIKII
jgi:Ca2+-transporting ATPase